MSMPGSAAPMELTAVSTLADGSVASNWVGVVGAWTYDYDGSTYAGTSYRYSAESDMSYPSAGTYCYNSNNELVPDPATCVGGTQVSKITFSFVMEAYTVSVTPLVGGVTVTHIQPQIDTVLTYFLVRSPDGVVFRVLGGASDGGLTSANYLTRVKVLAAEDSSYTGLCTSSPVQTDVSWTSNSFVTESTAYENVLSANGWDSSTGDVLSIGTDYSAAACFGEGLDASNPPDTATDVSDTQVCINNGVNIDEAKASCIGALLGNGTNQMLQSCIRDWCSFGGAGKITESYITEYRVGVDFDSLYLVETYVVPTVTAVEVVQTFTIISVSGNGTDLSAAEIMSANWKNLRTLFEQGYGFAINIVIEVAGSMVYLNGCNVESVWIPTFGTGTRRTAEFGQTLNVEYTATAPITDTNINTDGASAESLTSGVNKVKASDPVAYATCGTLSASAITSVSATTVQTVILTGGTQAPTASPGNADSELDTYLIIVGVVGLVVIVAVVVFVVVQISLKGGKSANTGQAPAEEVQFAEVGLKQIPPAEPVTKAAAPAQQQL